MSVFALKLARAAGLRVILSSSSDKKLEKMKEQYPEPPLLTVNYSNSTWHEDVLKLTEGVGVDIVVENGGTPSLVQSIKCTRRGGIVSQVGYLGKQNPEDLKDLVSTIIDRRVILRYGIFNVGKHQLTMSRGINAGSKYDMEDFCAALSASKTRLDDLIDCVFPFEKAEEAVEYLWQGKQVGKVVLEVKT